MTTSAHLVCVATVFPGFKFYFLCCAIAVDLTLTLGDKSALLAFKARGDGNNNLVSWSGATEPCRDGWDSRNAGWRHVMCCASYNGYACTGPNVARITYVGLNNMPGLRGTLEDLVPMTALIHLTVSQCGGVSGHANFREMRQLAVLNLYGTRGAYLNVVTLTTLSELSLLWLAGSNAYGAATVIRDSIPALSTWGSGHQDFTSCAVYSTCPAGTNLLRPAATSVGMDECACCDSPTDSPRDPWRRRRPTGVCYDPSASPPAASVRFSRPALGTRYGTSACCADRPLCVWLIGWMLCVLLSVIRPPSNATSSATD